MEKLTSELTRELKIQPEKINQLKNDKRLLQKQVLERKKENIKNRVASEENEQYVKKTQFKCRQNTYRKEGFK